MNICFVAYGPIDFASSRIRCYWPARYMDDTVVVTWQESVEAGTLPDADIYIWQKNADVKTIKRLSDRRHWWDVCDPLHWFTPNEARGIADVVDGIVASNQGLADDLAKWAGREVTTIPDRLELSHYPKQRQHAPVSPVRFIWYGIAVNRLALVGAWANLARLAANGHEIELTIMDERPNAPFGLGEEVNVYHVRWSLDQENEIIARHDIALLPPYPGPWGWVKSNNKVLTAYACGLPTTPGLRWDDGFIKMVEDAEVRAMSGRGGRRHIAENCSVEKSAREWDALLNHS